MKLAKPIQIYSFREVCEGAYMYVPWSLGDLFIFTNHIQNTERKP